MLYGFKVKLIASFYLFSTLTSFQSGLCAIPKKIKIETTQLVPEIKRSFVTFKNERGPVVANILEVDIKSEKISLKIGLPNKDKIRGKKTLSSIVSSEMATVGINAGYFDKNGATVGILIKENNLLVGPIYNRAAVGFTNTKEVYFDQVMLNGNLTLYRGLFKKRQVGSVMLDCFNTPPNICKGISLINSLWDEELFLEKDFAYVVRENCIKKKDRKKVKIPRDGYILTGPKGSQIENIKRWDCIDSKWSIDPDWSFIESAVSGGPYLIKDGEIYIDEKEENIHFAVKNYYAPRTAIGIGKNNKLYLIAVDGRQEGYSVGLSLPELAELLKRFGVENAINLDGGGSTTIVAKDVVLNRPSDGEERPISSALLIFYNNGNN